MENRIPPPVVFIVTALVMAQLPPSPLLQGLPNIVRGVLIALFLSVAALHTPPALWRFYRAGTTPSPLQPEKASHLVQEGPYRWTRNPMYVGLASALLAWATYLGSLWAFLGPLAFAAYLTRFQILPEERALLQLFGDDYREYQRRVPRWL